VCGYGEGAPCTGKGPALRREQQEIVDGIQDDRRLELAEEGLTEVDERSPYEKAAAGLDEWPQPERRRPRRFNRDVVPLFGDDVVPPRVDPEPAGGETSVVVALEPEPTAPPRPVVSSNGHATYPRVSVVIPALNEAKNLPHVLPRIPADVHEVLLVDGRSTDNTAELAALLWPGVRIIEQPGTGKGDALRAGFTAATGDVIVTLDADGSADPAEIPAFVGALLAGADFAKGSRFLQGGGSDDITFHRRAGNRGFVWLVRVLFGSRYTDLCYGYNAFWRYAVDRLDVDAPGFEIETALNLRALRAGLRVTEVSSFEYCRVHGRSRLSTITDGWRVLRTIMREASRRGVRSRVAAGRV
jgi:Glycosyl transferase family 2